MMADPLFRVANGAYFVAFIGLAIALVALHERFAPRFGRYGLIAFLVAFAGTMTQGGNMWFDGFAAPWLAEVAPQVFSTLRPTPIQELGALLSYGLMAVGWALYGLATLRARVFPMLAALGMVVAGLVAFRSSFPPYGVPLGLVVAALGAWLIRSDRAESAAAALR